MWFDATLGRKVEVYRSPGATTVLAKPRQLVTALDCELICVFGESHPEVEQTELKVAFDLAASQRLVELGGIVPFDEKFLAPYGGQHILRMSFIARPPLRAAITQNLRQGLTLEGAVSYRGDVDFPQAFALPGYEFHDLAVLAHGEPTPPA